MPSSAQLGHMPLAGNVLMHSHKPDWSWGLFYCPSQLISTTQGCIWLMTFCHNYFIKKSYAHNKDLHILLKGKGLTNDYFIMWFKLSPTLIIDIQLPASWKSLGFKSLSFNWCWLYMYELMRSLSLNGLSGIFFFCLN